MAQNLINRLILQKRDTSYWGVPCLFFVLPDVRNEGR